MESFGQTPDGRTAHLFRLENAKGFRADISEYGGTIVRLFAPDRDGETIDVVLGFDSVEEYAARSPYFGCIVGRYGNRIASGTFALDGQIHALAKNNHPGGIACHLHGGIRGFDKVMWDPERKTTGEGEALTLRYRSPHGEEGFPGNLDVVVVYTVTPDNSLEIDYTARTDRPTPVNLTNHTYFNLAGAGIGDVLGHVVTLNATRYTPVNAGLIPTGQIAAVLGTPLDFTQPHSIGERIGEAHEQLRFAGGYDHNFVLENDGAAAVPHSRRPGLVATVLEPESGRRLDVLTTEPALQFYSGNFLDGSLAGKKGRVYPWRGGFCLETQHFPDSPNQPSFPSTILRPGEILRSTTVYRFGAG